MGMINAFILQKWKVKKEEVRRNSIPETKMAPETLGLLQMSFLDWEVRTVGLWEGIPSKTKTFQISCEN